eukprot:719923-Prymnesium_polylepis.1
MTRFSRGFCALVCFLSDTTAFSCRASPPQFSSELAPPKRLGRALRYWNRPVAGATVARAA